MRNRHVTDSKERDYMWTEENKEMKTIYIRTGTKREAIERAACLYEILRDKTPVIADLNTIKAEVQTENVLVKYVPKSFVMDGIRCDIAVGFGQQSRIATGKKRDTICMTKNRLQNTL